MRAIITDLFKSAMLFKTLFRVVYKIMADIVRASVADLIKIACQHNNTLMDFFQPQKCASSRNNKIIYGKKIKQIGGVFYSL